MVFSSIVGSVEEDRSSVVGWERSAAGASCKYISKLPRQDPPRGSALLGHKCLLDETKSQLADL